MLCRKILAFLCLFFNISDCRAEGDLCKLEDDKNGHCIRFEHCPSAIALVKSRKGVPKICAFDKLHPIVCCAASNETNVGDISRQKCTEYSSFAVVDDDSSSVAGNTNPLDMPEIAGGTDANALDYIHMAVLGYGDQAEVNWACGGSLISEKYVLTAAHCINTRLGRVKYVRVGDLDLKLTTDIAKPQDFNMSRVINHPEYRAPSVYNDIALIELSGVVEFDKFVRPACLQTEANINDPYWVATGWGNMGYLARSADHLQEVKLYEFSEKDCQVAYSKTTKTRLNRGIDFKTQLCAGAPMKDTCQGDSGGPLQIRIKIGNKEGYAVIGVTSFGKACGIGNSIAVYTRVSSYIEWIESIVWPKK